MKNFSDKTTYLAARAEWKAEYKELSQQIREARKAYHDAQRAYTKATPTENYAAYRALNTARNNREALRYEASQKISELFAMKEEASRQWEAARVSTCE